MAVPGRDTDEVTVRMMHRMFDAGRSYRFIANELQLSTSTVYLHKRMWRTLREARAAELEALRLLSPGRGCSAEMFTRERSRIRKGESP